MRQAKFLRLTKNHLVSIQKQASIEAINSNQQKILRPTDN